MEIKFVKSKRKDLGYLALNFLPVISYEGFKGGEKSVYIAWLFWGINFKW